MLEGFQKVKLLRNQKLIIKVLQKLFVLERLLLYFSKNTLKTSDS